MTQDFPTLTFSVNRLVRAEISIGKDIADIVRELEGGAPSLTTMRALVAVGASSAILMRTAVTAGAAARIERVDPDFMASGILIEKHGARAASAAIGQAMNIFLADMAK